MSDPYELTPWELKSAAPSLLSKYDRLREVNAQLYKALKEMVDTFSPPEQDSFWCYDTPETMAIGSARSALAAVEGE